ncbi:MAG: hypothetical protein ACLT1B_00160 [Anaerobutyricum hallii]
MDKLKTIYKETDWSKIGIAAFYGYFAINILMKAFAYDHGDNIYKYFFVFGMFFLAIKLLVTKYTLRETLWSAFLLGIAIPLSIITKSNTWLLLFLTIIGMKNCSYEKLIKIAVYIRCISACVLVLGSVFGVYDIGFKTTPDTNYVELPVYGFGMGEPNYAFLSIFLTILLLLYYNYERLDKWWFIWTSVIALIFYEFTFCRTGITVFFFCWGLIFFEKKVKNDKKKFILALSIPVGALFSFITMLIFNKENPVLKLLNHFVSGRIYIINSYFKDQGLALLPRPQEVFYASYYGLIDNSYMFVLLYCGWFVAIFFLVLLCLMLGKLYKLRKYKELVMLAALALYGVLEQFVMNGFMNPFILLGAVLLYPDFLKQDKNQKVIEKEETYEAISNSAGA